MVEAGDVGPSAAQFAQELVAFDEKLVSVPVEAFIFLPEPVAFVFEPGPVGVAHLAQQIGDELVLHGEFPTKDTRPIFGVECPFTPAGLLLGRRRLDAAPRPSLRCRLSCDDDRVRGFVLVGERAGYSGQYCDTGAGDRRTGAAEGLMLFRTAAILVADSRFRASMACCGADLASCGRVTGVLVMTAYSRPCSRWMSARASVGSVVGREAPICTRSAVRQP